MRPALRRGWLEGVIDLLPDGRPMSRGLVALSDTLVYAILEEWEAEIAMLVARAQGRTDDEIDLAMQRIDLNVRIAQISERSCAAMDAELAAA